jgi:hypothetical protein
VQDILAKLGIINLLVSCAWLEGIGAYNTTSTVLTCQFYFG